MQNVFHAKKNSNKKNSSTQIFIFKLFNYSSTVLT